MTQTMTLVMDTQNVEVVGVFQTPLAALSYLRRRDQVDYEVVAREDGAPHAIRGKGVFYDLIAVEVHPETDETLRLYAIHLLKQLHNIRAMNAVNLRGLPRDELRSLTFVLQGIVSNFADAQRRANRPW